MEYEKLVSLGKEKIKEAKRKAKETAFRAKLELKSLKNDKKAKRLYLIDEEGLLDKADYVLGTLSNHKAIGEGNYITDLPDGNIAGVYEKEIFYTMQEGKKTYLVFEHVGSIAIATAIECKATLTFASSRVELGKKVPIKPQVNYRHYESLEEDVFGHLSETGYYERLNMGVLKYIPKEYYENTFNELLGKVNSRIAKYGNL